MSSVSDWKEPDHTGRGYGWGRLQNSIDENHTIERLYLDVMSVPLCTAGEAVGASPLPEPLLAKLKAEFHFDEGWDMMVAERLVYGLAAVIFFGIAQNIGNCVGASHAFLLACRIAHEILCLGQAEDRLGAGVLGAPYIPYTYGVGRLAGGMLGGGDGSYCGAQIEGTQTYGFLPCFTSGLEKFGGTLPQSDASTGRLFGRSKSELEKWMPEAKRFDLVEAPECNSFDEAKLLLVEKHTPLQICSGQGFTYRGFDARLGVHLYRPGGSWSHSMQIVAIFCIKGQWLVVIRNQWGADAHKGSPEIGIPSGCMVITAEDFNSWVKRAECIGIGEIKGLEANPGT